jgi:hypothetical protein
MYIVPILAAARLYLRIPPDPRLVSPVPAFPRYTQCDSLDPPPKLSVFCDIYYRVIVLLMRDEPAVGFFSMPTFALFAMKFALHPPPLFQTHPLFSSDSYHAGCPLSGSAAGSIWDVFLFSVRSTSGPFHTT